MGRIVIQLLMCFSYREDKKKRSNQTAREYTGKDEWRNGKREGGETFVCQKKAEQS